MAACYAGGLCKTWPMVRFFFVGCNVMSNVPCFFFCNFVSTPPFLFLFCKTYMVSSFPLLCALVLEGTREASIHGKFEVWGFGGIDGELLVRFYTPPAFVVLVFTFSFICGVAG